MPLKHLKYEGCDRIAVGFMTTYAYHHKCCEFEIPLRQGVLDTT